MDKYLIAVIVFNILISLMLVLFYFFKPKKINPLFGYRTKRSMKNKVSWKFAQDFAFKNWLLFLPLSYFSQIIMIISKIPFRYIGWYNIIEFTIFTFLLIIVTENKLYKLQNKK